MIRFVHTSGEPFDGDYIEVPCSLCEQLHCDCEHDPDALRTTLTEDERQAKLAEANAMIARAWAEKVERDLRFTLEMQRKDAA